MFEHVFSRLRIGSLDLPNRLVMPPMCTKFGTEQSAPTQRLSDYLVARAKGGVGLIIQEATAVRPEGKGGYLRWLGIWDDSFVPGYRQLVEAVHEAGAKIAIQLHHAGRQTTRAVVGEQPVAPSAVMFGDDTEPPRALSVAEIVALEDAFAAAAERVLRAGYDAIEVHGAHGYLLHQFHSPLMNRRDDEYGGDLDGRLRFSRNVLAKIRRVVGPEFPICFRISAEEGLPGGLALADNQAIVPNLVAAGADVIHVSSGVTGSPEIPTQPMGIPHGNRRRLAAGIKQVTATPVIAVGRIVDVEMAEEVLRNGEADLVAMGRALLADPELPNKARAGLVDEIIHCVGCRQGCTRYPIVCLVNPEMGREAERQLRPAQRPKKIAVVGGGPAGLEAARVAAARGHSVTLFEQRSVLGGLLRPGSMPPGKGELLRLADDRRRELDRLGVTLRLGQAAGADEVTACGAEAVIVATGGRAVVPNRPGMSRRQVVQAEDVLRQAATAGSVVVVMGGGATGCEVADYLAAQGKRVSIVTRIVAVEKMATDVAAPLRNTLLSRLQENQVQLLTGTVLEEVGEGTVTVVRDGERRELPADTVVLAQGYRPDRALAADLGALGVPVFAIGDAVESRTAVEAIDEGYEIAAKL